MTERTCQRCIHRVMAGCPDCVNGVVPEPVLTNDQVRKLSSYIPISRECLDDMTWRPLSAAERANWDAQHRDTMEAVQRRAEQQRELIATHERYVETLFGVAREVADHHAPVLVDGVLYCYGCDEGTYSEASPVWPCSTYRLVRGD